MKLVSAEQRIKTEAGNGEFSIRAFLLRNKHKTSPPSFYLQSMRKRGTSTKRRECLMVGASQVQLGSSFLSRLTACAQIGFNASTKKG